MYEYVYRYHDSMYFLRPAFNIWRGGGGDYISSQYIVVVFQYMHDCNPFC